MPALAMPRERFLRRQVAFTPRSLKPSLWVSTGLSDITLAAGMAAQFTAANSEYLSHAGNAILRGGTTWWRAGWIYLDSTAGNKMILDTRSTNNGMQFNVKATPVLEFTAGDGSTTRTITHGTTLSTATWYFWYCQYDGVNLGLSLDDGALATGSLSAFSAGTPTFIVGAQNTVDGAFFDGRQQCLCGGNGVLTAAQITALHNSGTPLSGDQTIAAGVTPGFFFRFNEPSGARIDQIGALSLTDNATVTTNPGTCVDVVGQINDLSVNGNHLTQTTQAAKPTWRTLPYLQFDGTDDFLSSSFTLPTVGTLVLVYRADSAAADYRLIGAGDANVGSHGVEISTKISLNLYVVLRNNGTTLDLNAGSAPSTTALEVLAVRYGPTYGRALWRNGALAVRNIGNGTITTGSIALNVGRSGTGTASYWPGRLTDILVFPTELLQAQLSHLFRYLGARQRIEVTDAAW